MIAPPKSIPPSIPVRKAPPNSHTGTGKDIPGPANYNPNVNTIKSKNRVADFSKKNHPRDVFSAKSGDQPGPGNYDPGYEMANKTANSFNTSGQSPMFMSKVPNCKDAKDDNGVPGPGHYVEKKKKKNLHYRSQSFRNDANGRGFMTSTKREGYWDNNIEAPFTKGTNISEGPGPWNYLGDKKSDMIIQRNNIKKSGVKPPFRSSDARSCMKRSSKVQSPGPGQYIDLESGHFLVKNNMNRFNSLRKVNEKYPNRKVIHFTSKSMRFNGGFFDAKDGPGPGDYDQNSKEGHHELTGILTKAQIKNKGKGGAVFKSTTNRFNEHEPNNPSVMILNKKSSNYNDLMVSNMKHQSPNSQYQGTSSNNRHVGFTATSPRFTHNQVFFGQKLKYTPGPGDYTMNGPRPKTYSHNRGVGRKQAFSNYVERKGTNNVVGPGSYLSTECSMIKKSYNMSLE